MSASLDYLLLLAQETNDRWADKFFGLDQDNRFVILILAIVFGSAIIIATVGLITGLIASITRRRMEAQMKRDMLDRGMSADEIAQIVEAAPPQNFMERWAVRQGKRNPG